MSTDLTILSPAQKQQFEWAEYLMKPETKQNEAVIKLPVRAGSLSSRGEKRFVVNDVRGIVADCNNEQEAHAIAHALNSQAGLLSVLEELIADGECYCADNVAAKGPCGHCKARSAIQGAKGQ